MDQDGGKDFACAVLQEFLLDNGEGTAAVADVVDEQYVTLPDIQVVKIKAHFVFGA
jgi:hypothetical protein